METIKTPKFLISKITCSCGNELECKEKWFGQGDWIHVGCEKCGMDSAYYVDWVYDYGKKEE